MNDCLKAFSLGDVVYVPNYNLWEMETFGRVGSILGTLATIHFYSIILDIIYNTDRRGRSDTIKINQLLLLNP